MSNYILTPPPHEHENYAYWENGFTESEVQRIRAYGESLLIKTATVGDGVIDPAQRRSKTSWMRLNEETVWLYDKIGWVSRQLNGQFFGFNISGFSEDLQYTTYESVEEGMYDWHIDSGFSRDRAPRKLSLTIQLSEPDEYEGGDLQILTGKEAFTCHKTSGTVCAFPSFTLHRVTPVIKGTRRSLVVWLTGSRFV